MDAGRCGVRTKLLDPYLPVIHGLLMPKRELTNMISMRLAPEDVELLDSVAALVPVVPRLTLARAALKIGLAHIRQNPARALKPR